MKHNTSWLMLMVIAILLLLAVTRHFEALFIVALIGILGAYIAYRQHVDRRLVIADAVASWLAGILAVVMIALERR